MAVKAQPSPRAGFRLSLRLRKLVGATWVAQFMAALPSIAIVELALARARAHLPAGELPVGERELVLLELLRPVAGPVVLAVALGSAILFAWSVTWHAGTVRWWGGLGAARVRLSEIIGHGIVWWWRFARLWLTGLVSAGVSLAALWLGLAPVLLGSDSGAVVFASLVGWLVSLVAVATASWLAMLRGAWLLGESRRRSAVVAWLQGLATTLRFPLRSLMPLAVFAVPGAVLLVLPLLVAPRFALVAWLLSWLGAAWCWVALFLSYAPQEPPEEWVKKMQARAAARAARPREQQPGYTTQRFPTQQ